MKIGIEAQRIFRKNKHGMDMVALELIRNLQKIDAENEYVIFVRPDDDDAVLEETSNLRIVRLQASSYIHWEQVVLPKAVRAAGCHLLHCTSNTAPFFSKIPLILTLHDIIYLENNVLKIMTGSGTLYQKFGNLYRKIVVPSVVRRSHKVITVSHFEKKRIEDYFRIGKDGRLTSIYNGVGLHFKRVWDDIELQRVRLKYQLPDRFLFFLGNTDPKKNAKGVLEAFSEFSEKMKTGHFLVMLDYDPIELRRLLRDLGKPALTDKIVLTGYVVNTDLPAIYSMCDLFLYPSLRESFGIPILEAMCCGAPVITSTTSSMPEIAGDAALLVDPFCPPEIASAITSVITNQSLKDALVKKGYQQADSFSWRKMAERTLKVYFEVIKEARKRDL